MSMKVNWIRENSPVGHFQIPNKNVANLTTWTSYP